MSIWHRFTSAKGDGSDSSLVRASNWNDYHTIDAGTITAAMLASGILGGPLALTGAVAATRFVGGTASGAPSTGTFAVGDFVIDQTGKVFVCTAAGTPGTWVGISKPGMVLLEQHTASNSATLDFTTCISAAYDEYLIEFVEVMPVTNAAALGCQVSTNGGSTWDTGVNYYNNNLYAATGTWVAVGATASYVQIAHNVSNGGILGVAGSVRVFPSGTNQRPFVGQTFYLPNAANRCINLCNSDYETGAFNAMRFLFSAGNIASGTIRVYGIAKS